MDPRGENLVPKSIVERSAPAVQRKTTKFGQGQQGEVELTSYCLGMSN